MTAFIMRCDPQRREMLLKEWDKPRNPREHPMVGDCFRGKEDLPQPPPFCVMVYNGWEDETYVVWRAGLDLGGEKSGMSVLTDPSCFKTTRGPEWSSRAWTAAVAVFKRVCGRTT